MSLSLTKSRKLLDFSYFRGSFTYLPSIILPEGKSFMVSYG
nr:MAG TPA: hypothetical protein [Caudoviricetes sp.]